jgi:hypothetical protein
MGVQADLGHCSMWQDLRAVEGLLFGYNDLYDGFEELWSIVTQSR